LVEQDTLTQGYDGFSLVGRVDLTSPKSPDLDFSRVRAIDLPPFILPLILLVIHPP
jgi:hypothetical protein